MMYQYENCDGILDFRSKYHKNWLVDGHLHEYSEILYCKSGGGNVNVNGQNINLASGQFIWIPPHYIHQYVFEDSELVCAVFSNDFIPLFTRNLSEKKMTVTVIEASELAPILENLYKLDKNDVLYISGCLNLVAAKVRKNSCFENIDHSDMTLYQKVVTYVAQHYMEDISLGKIAKKFGYNEKYLSHAFHQLTGINFKQFLAFYRISHAKKVFECGKNVSITDVASESGFAAINTFNRVFKKMIGMTPSEYKRKIKNN